MKILVISLAGIGDTLFATPLIHELRLNFPDAHLDALVLWNGARDLLETNPFLNRIFQKNLIKAGTLRSFHFLKDLRGQKYDISINTHPQSRIHYRWVSWFIGARTRVSHQYDNFNPLDRILVNKTLPQNYEAHSVENNLACLSLINAPTLMPSHDYEIYLRPDEHAWADEYINMHGLKDRTLFAIHVGSGGTKNLALRRWPLAYYMELIGKLRRRFPEIAVLLLGGPDEELDNAKILAVHGPPATYQPKTKSVRHAAALLKRCQLFLSVDTALMHVAAAMKVPGQIVIETPTWNKPIQPYGNSFLLVPNPALAGRNLQLYRYDGKGIRGAPAELTRYMESVSVDAVYEVIVRAMQRIGTGISNA